MLHRLRICEKDNDPLLDQSKGEEDSSADVRERDKANLRPQGCYLATLLVLPLQVKYTLFAGPADAIWKKQY